MAGGPERSGLARFRYEYGAQPLHLLATVASLGIALYAILRIFEIPSTAGILLWLGGAIIAHDLIALPLYSLLLRIAERGAGAAIESRSGSLLALNHVRIPAAISLLLLLICFPLVFQIDETRYQLLLGDELTLDPFLERWLLITAALFLISGLHYALQLRRGDGLGDEPARAPSAPAGPVGPPSRALLFAARGVLAIGALFALWVAAAVVYGLFNAFPI